METPLCTYASKPCMEPRARKENGELHRLCDFHRISANAAQRRWHARHQSLKRAGLVPPGVTRPRRRKRRAQSLVASQRERTADQSPGIDVIEMAKLALNSPMPTVPAVHGLEASYFPVPAPPPPPRSPPHGTDPFSDDDLTLLHAMLVGDDHDDADDESFEICL